MYGNVFSTEMVLSVFPDTLFTTTTNDQQASGTSSSSFGPTGKLKNYKETCC